MNVYLAKFMMYYEIHRMYREGHSITQISKHLVLNRRTVSHYLAMDERHYESFLNRQSDRRKVLDAYEGFVKERLESYRDTSAAQMHDWLKEYDPDFPVVNPKTVFNFVCHVRKKYNLPRTKAERQFGLVEELPYGKQAQVDFGEYNMRTAAGNRTKVFFFILVLSRSRFKYIWFTETCFTAGLAIQAHEQAFEYIRGIPDQIVYDQDKVFIVSENSGDIILTEAFRNYTRSQPFQLYFCRKADPQSKGKVENVVKYVKQNFLYNRTFHNIETLNDEAMNWLGRTANMLPHAVTKKEPCSEWHIEQPFLKPYRPCPVKVVPISTYTVRTDNSILYKGNLYSLPLGTYQGKGTKVAIKARQGYLVITDKEGNHELCRHRLAVGKGKKVINTDHKRDKTAAINQMITGLSQLLPDTEKGEQWLAGIRKDKPRYIRDQIIMIRETIRKIAPEIVAQACDYCLENHIYNATDFKAIINHLLEGQQSPKQAKIVALNPISGSVSKDAFKKPDTSAIEDYQQIINKDQQNGKHR